MADVVANPMVEAVSPPAPPTLEEFLDAYTHQAVEVVHGRLIPMTPPDLEHSSMAHILFRSLDPVVIKEGLGKLWMETAYMLEADERSDWVLGVRVPDVSFTSTAKIKAHYEKHAGKRGPFRIVPDLAVEIVSANDRYVEIMEKVNDYLQHGVRLIWVIDAKTRTVRVFSPENPDGHTLSDTETLTANPVIPGWSMPIKTLLDAGNMA